MTSLSLAPGQDIIVGLPLRMSGTCYEPGSFARIDTFYVKERFLFFTRWVPVQFEPDLLIRDSYKPGAAGIPAKDLVCPAGATKQAR